MIRFVSAFVGEFVTAESVGGSFEGGDAEETPFGIGDVLNEGVFFYVDVAQLQIPVVSAPASSNVRFTDRSPTGRVRWRTP